MRVNEDIDACDDLIEHWRDMGDTDHIVRSHRRPKRGGHIGIMLTAATLATGIAVVAVTVAPNHTTASVTFASPHVDDSELLERTIIDAQPPASRSLETRQASRISHSEKMPITHWVNAILTVHVTSCFGKRWGTRHLGIDFNGDTGDKIRSVGDGVVVQSGWRYSGYGYSIVVRYAGGWMAFYGHLSRVTARTGQRVHAGDQVGLMGSTGYSTGSHLHFGLAKTSSLSDIFVTFVDPAPWLRSHKLSAGSCI